MERRLDGPKQNRLEIALDFCKELSQTHSKIVNRIMHEIRSSSDSESVDYDGIDPLSDSGSTNLFRGEVISKLFNHLKSITIACHNHRFSFSYLLSMISKMDRKTTVSMLDERCME